ncbi:NADPH-dependent FMN reductase [Paraburkholderia tropica]|uniref:NADPH-dependent FMN reductase n=1 Tax=Paraburkholderia tropica TaxID=92647 RepID=UPI002AB7B22E|nr:NAD(P)H-dependent oxidoreductase [Paraburkholderia tropica]
MTSHSIDRDSPVRIVAIGGTVRQGSSTEKALRLVLRSARESGADVQLFAGADLELPLYAPERAERTEESNSLIEALRAADGVVLGSPGYHGGISGLVKNALDYTEDMAKDPRPYFDGRAVGCLATGSGWQGANATLSALRQVVHALRGWPTPIGVAINTREPVFDTEGECLLPDVGRQLEMMGQQVVDFARLLRQSAAAEGQHRKDECIGTRERTLMKA